MTKQELDKCNTVEGLAKIIMDRLLLDIDEGRRNSREIKDMLDYYDRNRMINDRKAIIIFETVLENYLPFDCLFEKGLRSWKVTRKTKEESLKNFYKDWYFYQAYKNKKHYEGEFDIVWK